MPIIRENVNKFNPLTGIAELIKSIELYLSNRPILVSAILLTFFLNYKEFLITPLQDLFFSFIIIFSFIYLVKHLFTKTLEKYAIEINQGYNSKNVILGIIMAIFTNGAFIFSDILNYKIKFKTKELPFLDKNFFDKKIRVGMNQEANIRLIIVYSFIFITSILYSLNNIYDSGIIELLYRLSFFSLINSVIPYSIINSLLTFQGTISARAFIGSLSNYEIYYTETGATRIFLGARRRYIFTLIFVLIYCLLLSFNLGLSNVYIASTLIAITIFSYYLTKIEFDTIKDSVIK